VYLSEIEGIEVKKDGYFENFGKLGRVTLNNTLSFINSEKYLKYVDKYITCIVCSGKMLSYFVDKNIGVVLSNAPKNTFYEIYFQLFSRGVFSYSKNVISKESYISSNAFIANSGVVIGNNCIIEDGVVIREGTILGENVIVRNNSVVGSEGFEVAEIRGKKIIVPHTGYCIIKNNVEILNNTCVCKGLFKGYDTVIEKNVKIDNFVQIAHAVKIGENSEVAGGVVISGNTEIGKKAWIGPNATISNGIKIGDNVHINIGAVVVNDLKDGEYVSGNYAYDHRKFLKDFISKKIY